MKHSFRRLGGAVVAVSSLILAMLTGPVAAAPSPVAAAPTPVAAAARPGTPGDSSGFTDGSVFASQLSWEQTGLDSAWVSFRGTLRCSEVELPGWPDCEAEVGMPFVDYGTHLEFGDGTWDQPQMKVTRVSLADDVIDAETEISHHYSGKGPGPFLLSFVCGHCLPGPPLHINNPDAYVHTETLLDLRDTSASPVALMVPIVDCPMNAVCRFTVPAVDRGRQPLRWRFSTLAESGFVQPRGAKIDAATGVYTWDTTGATVNPTGDSFYSTHVTVESVSRGKVVSRSALFFFIRLNADTTNHPPVFAAPTPADGTVIHGTVGMPLSIDFAASDQDSSDTLTVDARGWTQWSIPGLSFSGTSGNPASGALSGTPTEPGDYLLNATVTDQSGRGATARGYVVHIAGDRRSNVVGSGYVGPPGTTFAMNVGRSFLGGFEGSARIRTGAGIYFRSTRIVSIRFAGDTATIVAKGTWGGATGATATIKVVDGSRDAFGVVVKKGTVTVLNVPIRPLTRGTITIGW